MKKIYIFLSFICILSLHGMVSAETVGGFQVDNIEPGLLSENLDITTYTSEPCGIAGEEGWFAETSGDSSQLARYKCTISASTGFIDFISSIYKYIFFITLVIGVLMLVVIGILMSIGWVLPDGEALAEKAKSKIMDIVIGLVALAMIPWILKTIAPFFFI